MKTPSDDICLLIKSLTKTEKRYIKLSWVNIGKKNKDIYLKLFDEIEKQDIYDEGILKQQTRLIIRNFEKTKRSLSKTIIKYLKFYYSESIFELVFKEQFKELYVLYHKGLYRQCFKTIDKLKKQLIKYERYTELIELLRFEKKLSVIREIDTEEINCMSKESIEKLVYEIELQNLSDKSFEIIKKNKLIDDKSDIRYVNTILKSPLVKPPFYVRSFLSEITRNKIFIYCHSLKGEFEKSYLYMLKQLELFDLHEHQKIQFPQLYINCLQNIKVGCDRVGRVEEYTKYFKLLDRLEAQYSKSGSKYLAAQIFDSSTNNKLEIMERSGNFYRVNTIFNEIEEKLEIYSQLLNVSSKLRICISVAYCFFGSGNFSKALLLLNRMIALPKVESDETLVSYVRILNILVHYEMNNIDSLNYYIRSTYRFIRKKGRLNNYERCILDFIQHAMGINDMSDRRVAFVEFKKQLHSILVNPLEKKPIDGFDLISWVDSKIKDQPLAEIVKEKNKAGIDSKVNIQN